MTLQDIPKPPRRSARAMARALGVRARAGRPSNTPRLVTQPSNNAQRWSWNSDAFGTNPPNENPSGLGTFKYNLRFPGQQYDGLAGLYYNYFRDYDAATGRYVESDPIGQRLYFSFSNIPGVSPRHRGYWNHLYNYVDASPTHLKDPKGLGWFDVLSELFKDKAPEEITTKAVAGGLAALCITRNCGKTRDAAQLTGDCLSILGELIKENSPLLIGLFGGITGDAGAAAASECAELCEKGIKSSSCCKESAR